MNTKLEILDCTIRDGGYYNNWDFDNLLIEKYITAMLELPIDIIEIGYRSIPQKEYYGKHFYSPDSVINKFAILNKNKKLALMFNEKDTRPEDLDILLMGLEQKVSLIRLAVNPENLDRAINAGKEIKKRGFLVAFNLMYMSKYYKDSVFLNKLSQLNDLVEYLNIVDSYGGMLPTQVNELITIVKSRCNTKIGFHGHNNMELAFANTLAAIDAGCNIVDSTIMGMGRGAGNLKTELLLTYLASKGDVDFDFNKLSAIIEEWIPLQVKYEWGTNLPYMVSGANSLPQKEVMEWVTQKFYSYNSIIRALNNQKFGELDNIQLPRFTPQCSNKYVLIIGGGPNAENHSNAIKLFIEKIKDVCIVHASSKNAKSYEDVILDQIYCLVGNEGHRLEKVFNDFKTFRGKCILPPYPRKMGTYLPEVVKPFSYELVDVNFTDNYKFTHTALALQTAIDLNAEVIYLAGYDGYENDQITNKEQTWITENEYLFQRAKQKVKIVSLTSTRYSIETKSVYSII
ncbi:MAG: aldolase catalytic domain-containing protein [Tenuifilaceae bacterium]